MNRRCPTAARLYILYYILHNIYIYIEREREREREGASEREGDLELQLAYGGEDTILYYIILYHIIYTHAEREREGASGRETSNCSWPTAARMGSCSKSLSECSTCA